MFWGIKVNLDGGIFFKAQENKWGKIVVFWGENPQSRKCCGEPIGKNRKTQCQEFFDFGLFFVLVADTKPLIFC